MSTAIEIEAAIGGLPSSEQTKLLAKLSERNGTSPKTGAELAALWRSSFHLTTQEGDDFARDMDEVGKHPPRDLPWE